MARFRGTIRGERGKEASRLGRQLIVTKANGWVSGVRVVGSICEDDKDEFSIFATPGSDTTTPWRAETFIGTVKRDDNGNVVFIPWKKD